jgi:hypothetical protein
MISKFQHAMTSDASGLSAGRITMVFGAVLLKPFEDLKALRCSSTGVNCCCKESLRSASLVEKVIGGIRNGERGGW